MSNQANEAQLISDRNALANRGLRPVSELGASRPHGHRLRYMAGCRCTECRAANTAYERKRSVERKAGRGNGIVCAAAARSHLAQLSRTGVGRRTVQAVSGVADTVLQDLIAGRKTRIRAETERRILGVTTRAAADKALIDAGPTWKLLDELLADGYSKACLARQLLKATPALQIGRSKVTVRTAFEVERMYARLGFCDARAMLKQLDMLADEGYRSARIGEELNRVAGARGVPVPDLAVRRGRVLTSTAVLVNEVFNRLTE